MELLNFVNVLIFHFFFQESRKQICWVCWDIHVRFLDCGFGRWFPSRIPPPETSLNSNMLCFHFIIVFKIWCLHYRGAGPDHFWKGVGFKHKNCSLTISDKGRPSSMRSTWSASARFYILYINFFNILFKWQDIQEKGYWDTWCI